MYQKIKQATRKMGKMAIIAVTMFIASIANAQMQIAVFDFKAGVGVNQSDVDGISAIFGTYFISPQKFTLVERAQIDRVISEQGFQYSSLTNSQRKKIGEILNIQKMVVGDINVVSGQYNIDVRVVDVETGTVYPTEGATWEKGTSYRELMKSLASNLISKISYQSKQTNFVNTMDIATNIELATKALDNALYDLAIEYAQKAAKIVPNHFCLLYFIGVCYCKKGDYKEAINYLSKAVMLIDKNNFQNLEDICKCDVVYCRTYEIAANIIYHNMAFAYRELKDYEKAVSFYLKMAQINIDDDNFLTAYNEIVSICVNIQEYSLAEQYSKQALASPAIKNISSSKDAQVYFYTVLVNIYAHQQRMSEYYECMKNLARLGNEDVKKFLWENNISW
jgi:tetratricopeptide (TPR) repeat protein